jgi:hypothetical protein
MTFSTSPSPGVTLQGGGSSGGGGGGAPGGSSGQVQYNNGGAFGGMAGTSWDNTTRALTITGYSLTGSASASFMDLAGTWNTSGTPTAIKLNITDTASNAASLLMDLQRSGTTRFSVSKTGAVNLANSDSGNGALLLSGGFWGSIDAFSFALKNNNGSFVLGASSDLLLTRRGAANLRLGAADTTGTTAPTPQFLSAQSWASSTTNNQTGVNFTIDGSQGTGTGAGGSIVFRVAPAGGVSNGVQNALATALVIRSNGSLQIGSNGNVYIESLSDYGIGLNCRNNSGYAVGLNGGTTGAFIGEGGPLAWSSTQAQTGRDLFLTRDAANTLALRNGAAAQTFRVYNTTDGTNSEFLSLSWASNIASIGVGTAGTGAPQILRFTSARSGVDTAWELRSTGSTSPRLVLAGTDRSVTLYPQSNMLTVADGGVWSNIDYSSGASSVYAFKSTNSNATVIYFGLIGSAANVMQINNGSGRGSGYGAATEMWEMTAPAAPATNGVRIYAEDNGSGKTRLMAIFATGAAQQIAIEP